MRRPTTTREHATVPSAIGGPVFIGGEARSGKTLVRRLLARQTGIAFSRRTNLWPGFFGRYGDLTRARNVDRCLGAMLERKQIASLNFDPAQLRAEFVAGPRTYPRLFELVHRHHAAEAGAVRWGDQSALVEAYADEVMLAYPGARFVHLVRDPRDRLIAVREKYGSRAGLVGLTTARWCRSAGWAELNAGRYPDAYHVIRYEDLVRDPGATVATLCEFLAEPFRPELVPLLRRDGGGLEPLSTDELGRYRDDLESFELAFIEGMAGRGMRAHGYDRAQARTGAKVSPAALSTWVSSTLAFLGRRLLDGSRTHAQRRGARGR